MSDTDYDPVTSLREEVDRFMATNQFTPLLVTNFYVQARCVLNKLAELQAELEQAKRCYEGETNIVDRVWNALGIDSYLDAKGKTVWELVSDLRARLATAEADTKRLDWLDEQNAKINAESGTNYGWQFSINHNRAALMDHHFPALKVREAIDKAKGGAWS